MFSYPLCHDSGGARIPERHGPTTQYAGHAFRRDTAPPEKMLTATRARPAFLLPPVAGNMISEGLSRNGHNFRIRTRNQAIFFFKSLGKKIRIRWGLPKAVSPKLFSRDSARKVELSSETRQKTTGSGAKKGMQHEDFPGGHPS